MNQSGFSIIELVIVLAVVAILATLAIPSYSTYIAKQNLRRAQIDLEFLSFKLESRYQRVLSYPTEEYANTSALQAFLTTWTPTSDQSVFNFSTDEASATSYTLIATGLSGLVKDCTLSLTHNGIRSTGTCTELTSDGEWL